MKVSNEVPTVSLIKDNPLSFYTD